MHALAKEALAQVARPNTLNHVLCLDASLLEISRDSDNRQRTVSRAASFSELITSSSSELAVRSRMPSGL